MSAKTELYCNLHSLQEISADLKNLENSGMNGSAGVTEGKIELILCESAQSMNTTTPLTKDPTIEFSASSVMDDITSLVVATSDAMTSIKAESTPTSHSEKVSDTPLIFTTEDASMNEETVVDSKDLPSSTSIELKNNNVDVLLSVSCHSVLASGATDDVNLVEDASNLLVDEMSGTSSTVNILQSDADLTNGQVAPKADAIESPLMLTSNEKLTSQLVFDSMPITYQDLEPTPITQSFFLNDTNAKPPIATHIVGEPDPPTASSLSKSYRSIVVYSSSEEDGDSDSADSDSSSSSAVSSNSDGASSLDSESSDKRSKGQPQKKKDLTAADLFGYDLPAIENLEISVKKDEIQHYGIIKSIIESFSTIVVSSLKGMPVLDFGTVLFLEDGQSLGSICEVFGRVEDAHYTVSVAKKDIVKKKLCVSTQVFYAPRKEDITKLVFAKDLLKTKGSDASWLDNQEPPEGMLEYSDDEEEKRAKQKKKKHRRAVTETEKGSTSEQPDKKKDKRYDSKGPNSESSDGAHANEDIKDGSQSTRWRPRFQGNTFESLPSTGSAHSSAFRNRASFQPRFYNQPPSSFNRPSFLMDCNRWPPSNMSPTVPAFGPGGHFPQGAFSVPPPAFGAIPHMAFSGPPPLAFRAPPPTTFATTPFQFNNPPPSISNDDSTGYNFRFSSTPPPVPSFPTLDHYKQNGNRDQSLNSFFACPPPPPPF